LFQLFANALGLVVSGEASFKTTNEQLQYNRGCYLSNASCVSRGPFFFLPIWFDRRERTAHWKKDVVLVCMGSCHETILWWQLIFPENVIFPWLVISKQQFISGNNDKCERHSITNWPMIRKQDQNQLQCPDL